MTDKSDELKRLYIDEQMTQKEMSKHFNVSRPTISRWLRDNNIKTRSRGGSEPKFNISKEKLEKLYYENNMSLREIGNKYGFCARTVRNYMKKYNIPRRKPTSERFGCHVPDDGSGYEAFNVKNNGSSSKVKIHQLVLIANGADPYKVFSGGEYHVHHKNGHKFDNRAKNLELLTAREHAKLHRKSVRIEIDSDTLSRLYHDEGMSLSEVSDELGVSPTTVQRRMKEHGIDRRTAWSKCS